MLILTRRIGESLIIGNNVVMTVLGVKGNQVRIGVNAPKEVSVHREEIYERIQKEKTNNFSDKDNISYKSTQYNHKDDNINQEYDRSEDEE